MAMSSQKRSRPDSRIFRTDGKDQYAAIISERQTGQAGNSVRVSAMVQQIAERRRRNPRIREIDVRQIRGDDARADEQRALPLRAAAPHGKIGKCDADQRMRDVVQD